MSEMLFAIEPQGCSDFLSYEHPQFSRCGPNTQLGLGLGF
jgi:hypothetical protein